MFGIQSLNTQFISAMKLDQTVELSNDGIRNWVDIVVLNSVYGTSLETTVDMWLVTLWHFSQESHNSNSIPISSEAIHCSWPALALLP